MNRISIFFMMWLLIVTSITAQEWPAVTPEARPATRWWWLGSAVDKQNLTYNLEKYAEAGMGGVEITPIYGVQGNEANEIPFLSSQWMEMLQHTQSEGKRLRLDVDMNAGTGWPLGGPMIDIEQAATKAIFQEYRLSAGEKLNERIEPKDKKQRPVAKLAHLIGYSDKGERIDLTGKVKNGVLQWTATAGNWQIIALFEGKTFQMVKRAAPGGEGYVMDHFSAQAVDRYFASVEKAFKEIDISYPRTFFNDSYEVYGADWTPGLTREFARRRGYRLEDYFPEFLATANGNKEDTNPNNDHRDEITARIVSDYRETLSELLHENFTRRWTTWAHRNGSTTRNQAHGSPGNLIDLYASVDIPECEGFGLSDFQINGLRQDSLTRHNDSDLSMLKYASSAAHITGKPYTSSETFTWLTEHFRTSLSQCKPDLDLLFVSGVNHVFFHGTPYSPRDAEWPGWLFYASVNMSPTNTIWRDAPTFFDYITRCQSFLQQGKPDNDFLLYVPIYDMWHEQPGRFLPFDIHSMPTRAPKFIQVVNEIMQCGYDVDYISDALIRSAVCRDGQIVTSGGTGYKALIVPGAQRIPEEVLNHLLTLSKEGADIVFLENYPQDVPGFGRLEKRRQLFRKIATRLPDVSFSKTEATPLGKGRIITGSDYTTTLAACKAKQEEMKTKYGLQYIRRTHAEGFHYFIASLQKKDTEGWVTLSVPAANAAIYDPISGRIGLAQTRTKNGETQIYLQLRSGESLIIKTYNDPIRPNKSPHYQHWVYYTDQPFSISLDHGWFLHFIESEPAISGTYSIDRPVSWTTINHPDANRNRGTAVYTLTMTMPDIQADEWILDLGDVRECARVKINGQYAGTCWSAPFRLPIGDYLQKEANRIEIEVTNLPANRIADYDRRGIQWRKFKEINVVDLNYKTTRYDHWEPMPAGLNSVVRLIPAKCNHNPSIDS